MFVYENRYYEDPHVKQPPNAGANLAEVAATKDPASV